MAKLNQIVAVEKAIKSKAYATLSELHKLAQKPVLFNGQIRTYKKNEESGEDFPPEVVKVQQSVPNAIAATKEALSELFNITATKDFGNVSAKADVVLDGKVLVKDAPIPFLLFLEKQLSDLETFVSKLPTLDPAEDWTLDKNSGEYVTPKTVTTRGRKVQRGITLYPATPEHPAQTQLISEDVVVGQYELIKRSGALPATERAKLLQKVRTLGNAVKFAREEANSTPVVNMTVADSIFEALFD